MRLRQGRFRVQRFALSRQDLQVRRFPIQVFELGQPHGFTSVRNHSFPFSPDLSNLLIADEGVFHFPKGLLNGFFVGDDRLFLLGLPHFQVGEIAPCVEKGHRQRRPKLPSP